MPTHEDHEGSEYTPNWRSALYDLRLLGRLHELRQSDPKTEDERREVLKSTRKLIIRRGSK